MITHLLAGLVGAAFSFAVTRIANKLNGTDTLKQDYEYLKGLYHDALAKLHAGNAVAPVAPTPSA
jgi:hypothetical protein